MQTQSSADRITTSLSRAHQKKNKQELSVNLAQKACTNHWTNLRREETKRKKGFNLVAWEKETTNTVSFILKIDNNNNEKAEKYYTNE